MISFIFFVVVFAVFLCFIIFNLGNASNVSLGFTTFNDIPVFVTALFSFALGLLFTFPLLFTVGRRRRLKAAKARAEKLQSEDGQIETPQITDSRISDSRTSGSKLPPPKKSIFGRKSPKKTDAASEEDKIQRENSPYGID
jgi:uncharacterized integral membrane protein